MGAAKKDAGGCWPTQEQRLLLRASLLRGQGATKAWQEWRSRADIQILDRGSLRLLPLLYRNLRTHGVDDPLMDRFKGFYRFTWYKNQMLFQTMGNLLVPFRQAGIQTLLFKGAALILLYYRDLGLRPMDDFDVLVPTDRAFEAIHLLQRLGWRPMRAGGRFRRVPDRPQAPLFSLTHGKPFGNGAGRKVDLHWHLLHECTGANADDDFWAAAAATQFQNTSVYVMNPTDELLNVCIHGAKWDILPPLRWVADAMKILETSNSSLDWNRLIAQVERRRLALPLRAALHYLRDELDAPVPPETLKGLDQIRATKLEQIDFGVVTHPRRPIGPIRRLCHYYLNYLRQFDGAAPGRPRFGFLNYLKHRWGLRHLWELPFYAMARLRRSARKTLRTIHNGGGFSRKDDRGDRPSQPEKA